MKRVLVYGDSNTWGAKPIKRYNIIERYDFLDRFPGVLQDELGSNYIIIEEGNPGRTTIWDDPIEGSKNGKTYLIPCLDSHQPLDIVIINLGTNDLKGRFSLSAFDIARSAGVLVSMVQHWNPFVGQKPKVLLVSPPPISTLPQFFQPMFIGAEEKSKRFSDEFRKTAVDLECNFFDAGEYVRPSEIDGVHYEKEAHLRLGKELAKKIRQMLVNRN